MTVKTLVQKIADIIGYKVAIAKYNNEWHYVAHKPGCEPRNIVDYYSKGLSENFEDFGYNGCLHNGEIHRVEECTDCYILPIIAKEFDKTIFEPKNNGIDTLSYDEDEEEIGETPNLNSDITVDNVSDAITSLVKNNKNNKNNNKNK